MRERINPALRIICLGLAALVVYQLSRVVLRPDPLRELNVSAAPLLLADAEPHAAKKGTNSVPPGPSAKKGPDLSPEVQARVDRITQSEIFGAIIRPLPMALLGIAGKDAFLRAPNGQTGLLREGESLGGVKLLQIGTNRVLVEHEQQKKELTVFSGFGSETLLPKGKANPQ